MNIFIFRLDIKSYEMMADWDIWYYINWDFTEWN